MKVVAFAAGRVAFVALAVFAFREVINLPGAFGESLWTAGLLKTAIWVVPAAAVSWWLTRREPGGAWRALGLAPPAWCTAVLVAACTLPFAVPWWVMGHRLAGADELAGDVLLGPFAEEVLFRGFLFLGLRRLGLRFWSAGLLSALLFGLAHVGYLGPLLELGWFAVVSGDADLLRMLDQMATNAGGVILEVAAGGLLFAWVCDRWQSLWPAISLHMAINFWWVMAFGAEGGLNIVFSLLSPWTLASAASVTAAIVITLRKTRRPAPPDESSGRGASMAT